MAALYGRLKREGAPKEITRTSHTDRLESSLETWDGGISTYLSPNGDFEVYVGEKMGVRNLILKGNVNVNG